MSSSSIIETIIGLIVIIVSIVFIFYSIQMLDNNQKGQIIKVEFGNVGSLKKGDDVRISGINVGKITKLDLDVEDYNARVMVKLFNNIKIPDDSSARITSSSLLGGNYLDIVPGSSETFLSPNDIIYDTSDPVSFTDMLGKIVFSGNKE